ncbi:MAG: DUF4097 family beta strand repeat-containing protein [Rhodothermales bacterium]
MFTALPALAFADDTVHDYTDTVKEVFNVDRGGTLYVDMDHGNMEVDVVRGSEVRIEVERRVEGRYSRSEAEEVLRHHELDLDKRGDDVVIESRFDNDEGFWGRRRERNRLRIRVRVSVPDRYNVQFTTGAGNVDIIDVNGDIEGRTGAGNITIADTVGELEVNTGAGNINVSDIDGEADVQTGAGNVSLEGSLGQVEARTGAGNIDAHLSGGLGGDSSFTSGAGNVTVYVDRSVGAYVDAVASMGSASTNFDLRVEGKWMKKSFEGEINGGGPELYMRAGVGNVTLRSR